MADSNRTDLIQRSLSRSPMMIATDAYRFDQVLVVLLFLTTFDAPGLLSRKTPMWYVLLALPTGAIVLIRARMGSARIRRPIFSDVVLLSLMSIGLVGTTYGTLFRATTATARPTFVPMVLALLYLATLDQPTDKESDALLRWLTWVGVTYLLVNALVYFGVPPGPGLAGDHPFRNSQLLFVAMALVGAVASRRWAMLLLLALLTTFMVLTYPSATTILVAVGTIATLYMTQPRGSAVRPYVVAILVMIVVALASMRSGVSVDITQRYFSAVGKADTNPTRLAVWSTGIDRFEQSPIIGSGFAGSTNAAVVRAVGRRAKQIPFHNDYILFLAEGGVVGFGLLLTWVVATEITIVRRHRTFAVAGWSSHARLLRTLLVGFNAFFIAAAFNPQFTSVTSSASIFAVYALMMSLGAPSPDAPRR
jgi:O-antigen ligase